MAKVHCPHCDAVLQSTSALAGRRVRCGTCEAPFTVPDESEERRPRQPRRDDFEEQERPRRRASRSSSRGFPWVTVITVLLVLIVVGGLVGGGIYLVVGVSSRMGKRNEPQIAEKEWRKVEVPGRFRCQMPGMTTEEQVPGPPDMIMHQCSPTKDLVCLVGYTRDALPPDRLQVGNEQLLDDGCAGAMRNVRELGGTEISRKSILLNNRYQGRELLINVPRGGGKFIFRLYVINGLIYMIGVGGKGIEPGGAVPTKVFDSFTVI